jgi:hypothetical protein
MKKQNGAEKTCAFLLESGSKKGFSTASTFDITGWLEAGKARCKPVRVDELVRAHIDVARVPSTLRGWGSVREWRETHFRFDHIRTKVAARVSETRTGQGLE